MNLDYSDKEFIFVTVQDCQSNAQYQYLSFTSQEVTPKYKLLTYEPWKVMLIFI